ncbi:hypothetical protein [Micromonospora globbae]|jgi:hypothetical protein|uniref:Uncharacterized protein n=1 Tax=Micromonospora globbae TaxID=1894969 RepID=A0A420F441_9ACTN|nr:hypothetical protein [Micromonospora globbae]RKF27700.1 hypothetical protein D7I43_08355 [Micromonospora globbae]WTF86807.1 hypothetical protein OH732_04175 [Micromonospora globbae]
MAEQRQTSQQQASRQQQRSEEERRLQAAERNKDWADRAAHARTADDPRAVAPRDAAGRPSTGERF